MEGFCLLGPNQTPIYPYEQCLIFSKNTFILNLGPVSKHIFLKRMKQALNWLFLATARTMTRG